MFYLVNTIMSSIRALLFCFLLLLFFSYTSATGSVAISGNAPSLLSLPKINIAKVRDVRLSLHNTERETKSLDPFTYSSVLEWTASTWAQHLADIKKTSHKRKTTDGYYSYTNIKQRFIDQWVTFANKEKGGQPLFTENLWRNMYTCKKTDCTEDFIKAIKKSRTFFMSEKWRIYRPHYNAIMGNFTSIGLGVALTGNKYYLVTHYTQSLK